MSIFDVAASSLFSTRASQQAQLEGLAQRQLSNALELFVAKKYDEAISTFKRAIGLAPLSSTATNAYDYMARSYLSKEDVKSAIATYQESLRSNPTNAETHVALGKIYVTQEDLTKAKESFAQAVRLEPSPANRYALAQTHMEMGDYKAAEAEFRIVRDAQLDKPNGEYGLGLVYAKQGKTDDAISSFKRAISIQKDFWFAHVELGFALTDSGERDKAQEIVGNMKGKADDLADTLSAYIKEKTPAEMTASLFTNAYLKSNATLEKQLAAYNPLDFQKSLGPKTAVSSLSSYLSVAGGQQVFAMTFMFNKQMDAQSVENVLNWNITRETNCKQGSTYNFGMPVPSTEAKLDLHPIVVRYSAEDQSATLLFRITQNAEGNATIDPSHIKFGFSGVDTFGYQLSKKADEYTGFRGFA